jgi:hypothetical protein
MFPAKLTKFPDEEQVISVWEYPSGPKPKVKKRRVQTDEQAQIQSQPSATPASQTKSAKKQLRIKQPSKRRQSKGNQADKEQELPPMPSSDAISPGTKQDLTLRLCDPPSGVLEQHQTPTTQTFDNMAEHLNSFSLRQPPPFSSQFYHSTQDHSWQMTTNVSEIPQAQSMQYDPSASRYPSFDGSVMDYGSVGTPVAHSPMIRPNVASVSFSSTTTCPETIHSAWNYTSPAIAMQVQPSSTLNMQARGISHGLPNPMHLTARNLAEQAPQSQMVYAQTWVSTPQWESTPAAFPPANQFSAT